MNVRKSIALLAATLITAAGMSGIANYSNAAADSIQRATSATVVAPIRTLPTIDVHPSAEQLRQLRSEGGGAAGAYDENARMPYYSFGDAAGA